MSPGIVISQIRYLMHNTKLEEGVGRIIHHSIMQGFRQFLVVFGMDILGMGCAFVEKFCDWGPILSIIIGNNENWDKQ